MEVSTRKTFDQRRADVQLTARLILRAVEGTGIAPGDALRVGVDRLPYTAANRAEHTLRRGFGGGQRSTPKECWRVEQHDVASNRAAADPDVVQPKPRLATHELRSGQRVRCALRLLASDRSGKENEAQWTYDCGCFDASRRIEVAPFSQRRESEQACLESDAC